MSPRPPLNSNSPAAAPDANEKAASDQQDGAVDRCGCKSLSAHALLCLPVDGKTSPKKPRRLGPAHIAPTGKEK